MSHLVDLILRRLAALHLGRQSRMLSLRRTTSNRPQSLGLRMPRNNKPPPMRRIAEPDVVDDAVLERVWYKPHKQHCSGPSTWTSHKTKCPRGIGCSEALEMLKEGIRRSMIPPGITGLPAPVWAVDDRTGLVYEARITNPDTAEYHGYPVLDRDPLRAEIIRQWRARAR